MDSTQFQPPIDETKKLANQNSDVGDSEIPKIFLNYDKHSQFGIATFDGQDDGLCLMSGFVENDMYKVCRYQKFSSFMDQHYKYVGLIKSGGSNSFDGYYEEKAYARHFSFKGKVSNKLEFPKFYDKRMKLFEETQIKEPKEDFLTKNSQSVKNTFKKGKSLSVRKHPTIKNLDTTIKNIDATINSSRVEYQKSASSALLPGRLSKQDTSDKNIVSALLPNKRRKY